MGDRKAKKRCERCGHVGLVPERRTKCRRQNFGPNSFWCYGRLVAVERKVRAVGNVAVPEGKGLGWVLTDEAEHARCEQFRTDARKQRDAAAKKIAETITKIKRATTSLELWRDRERRYAEQERLTDAEIATAREKRLARSAARKAKNVRRAIQVARS